RLLRATSSSCEPVVRRRQHACRPRPVVGLVAYERHHPLDVFRDPFERTWPGHPEEAAQTFAEYYVAALPEKLVGSLSLYQVIAQEGAERHVLCALRISRGFLDHRFGGDGQSLMRPMDRNRVRAITEIVGKRNDAFQRLDCQLER